jgi:hypothetical protein
MPQGNRRIDKVLDPDFVAGLGELSLEDLRERRREAEQEETDLSYLRRLLQGRRHILADDGPSTGPRGLGRHVTSEPSRADAHRRHVEQLVADVDLSNPSAHDDASLRRVLETLQAEEHKVSESRRSVQQVMDALSGEVTRRYREGDADPSDLLPTEA